MYMISTSEYNTWIVYVAHDRFTYMYVYMFVLVHSCGTLALKIYT